MVRVGDGRPAQLEAVAVVRHGQVGLGRSRARRGGCQRVALDLVRGDGDRIAPARDGLAVVRALEQLQASLESKRAT